MFWQLLRMTGIKGRQQNYEEGEVRRPKSTRSSGTEGELVAKLVAGRQGTVIGNGNNCELNQGCKSTTSIEIQEWCLCLAWDG